MTNLRFPKDDQNRFRDPVVAKQQGCAGHPWVFPLIEGAHVFPNLSDLGSQAAQFTKR